MKLLVDVQLPARLAVRLAELGHEAVHTGSLPEGNRTTDRQIAAMADRDRRVVVTKDGDFRNAHLLTGSPNRVLIVATGNISNDELLGLIEARLPEISEAFVQADHVEIRRDAVLSFPRARDIYGRD